VKPVTDPTSITLIVLRCIFLLVAAGLAAAFLIDNPPETVNPFLFLAGSLLVAVAVVIADILLPSKRIDMITAVYFGLLVGLLLAYVVGIALTPYLTGEKLAKPIQQLIGMVICYTCISVLLQTKDDFRFIIPYVEFSKEIKGLRPYILDTSVVIDGRIADVVETRVLDNQLIMPRFVLAELQNIADSADKLRRSRGRRGLDILNRLRGNPDVDLDIYDRELPEMASQPVDMKLVLLAKHLEGKLITGDYNLNKVARLHNVQVINLNDLANALKPVFLPGEHVDVRIVKPGEEEGQGVGYLDDGTMIVVEGGRPYINKSVQIAVTSVLQTSAGRMIFGRFEELLRDGHPSAAQDS
jgi:uncharacterized protein YacL